MVTVCTARTASWARRDRPPCPPGSATARWRRFSLHAAGGEGGQRSSSNSQQNQDPAAASPGQLGSSGGSAFSSSPWQLMGRMVSEQRVALQYDTQLNQGLVRSAAALASGLDYEEFELRLQRLLTLLPFLQDRMLRMQPKLLAALAADPERVAGRLIQLKLLLPLADVASMVGQRPSLLLDGEWERVAGGAAQLAAVYSEAEVAKLASAEPLLLVEDLQRILAELQRLLPQQEPAAALLRQPSLASNVSSLSHLSLW